MGPVGAGKSTLCLSLNGAIPHAVDGQFKGQVLIDGQDTRSVSMGQLSMQVGFVFENAQAQLFSATVADEVAFGLEAMGLPVVEIERRIVDSLALVGLSGMEQRVPQTLSGGEQRRLALASVLAMRPSILVLDEPTSGLDPLGRQHILDVLHRLRRESGRELTVVMATQDAEAVAQFADRVVVLQEGRVALVGAPRQVLGRVEQMEAWGIDVPQLARLAAILAARTGRAFDFVRMEEAQAALGGFVDRGPEEQEVPFPSSAPAAIEIDGLAHRYPGTQEWALQDISLKVARGDWLAVVGVNGAGKSTLIKHLNGLLAPTRGNVRICGRDAAGRQVGDLAHSVAYLPQDPDKLIFCSTVYQEVAYGPQQLGVTGRALEDRVRETLEWLDLQAYERYPPAVLGYGLRRQVALASVLAMQTPILALDEPAVGLDWGAVQRLMDVLARRRRDGMTVVMISHDLRLVARYANRVAVLDRGRLIAHAPAGQVLAAVDTLLGAGLVPLPVTELARRLDMQSPLPVRAVELADRLGPQ